MSLDSFAFSVSLVWCRVFVQLCVKAYLFQVVITFVLHVNNPSCCTISLEAFVWQVELLSKVMYDCTIISMDYISSVRIIISND